MHDRSFVIAPGLKLYCTPSGWYTFEWELDNRLVKQLDLLTAVIQLRELVQDGFLLPATGPRQYNQDTYRTAEEALDDLCNYALIIRREGERGQRNSEHYG